MAFNWPTVSVVFLAYDRREELSRSLDRVTTALDYPEGALDVLVVDNASTDGTAEMVRERFPEVQLIRNPENHGVSGWNVGLNTATGEYILALDDDCFLTGDALRTAVREAIEHRADLVSFRVRSGLTDHWFNEEYETGLLTFWGCSALFSRRAVESLRPFYDPNIFIWANEMELTMRLLDRGYRHLHLPHVESVHMKLPTTGFHERATHMNSRHFAYIAAKLMQPGDAVRSLANLTLNLLLQGYSIDPRALKALPDIARGAAAGLRVRAPVREPVSRAYARNERHYAEQFSTLRSPLDRLRHADANDQQAKIARWFDSRPRFYPAATAVLEL